MRPEPCPTCTARLAAETARAAASLDVDHEAFIVATGGDCGGTRATEGEPPRTVNEEDGA